MSGHCRTARSSSGFWSGVSRAEGGQADPQAPVPSEAPHQRRKRGKISAPSAATIAVASVYQVARKGAVSSGQCRL